jgi:hypothetical protein
MPSRTVAHSRSCAARNWTTSLLFLLFCGFEALLCWRELAQPLPDYRASIVLLLGYDFVVFLLADLMLSFRCLRERIVLTLGLVSFVKAVAVGVAPWLFASNARAVREFSFILWAAASLVSLSLLKSALTFGSLGEPPTEGAS